MVLAGSCINPVYQGRLWIAPSRSTPRVGAKGGTDRTAQVGGVGLRNPPRFPPRHPPRFPPNQSRLGLQVYYDCKYVDEILNLMRVASA